jgi:hypothetical protein
LISGWCFINEAHVAVTDQDFRDFSKLHEATRECPQICCMSATIQQTHLASLSATIGRTHFTNGITMTPHREALSLKLRISFDPKLAIMEEIQLQPKEEKQWYSVCSRQLFPSLPQ